MVLSGFVFSACNTFFADLVSFTGSFTGSFLSCFGLLNEIVTQTSFAVATTDIKLIYHHKAAASLDATAFLNFDYSIISQ